MSDMPKHDIHEAAGRPYRRARAWAWGVFWVTAAIGVLYNCYHALAVAGQHMPWYTGVPEGVAPLVVAIGVLEFSSTWRERDGKILQVAAWLVTAGAMAWSALAVNSVIRYGWALGLIVDTAALSAMYFLMAGPTAEQAVAKVARRIAEVEADRDDERSARRQAEAAHRREISDVSARHADDVSALRRDLKAAESALESARTAEAGALERAEALTAKLTAVSARKPRNSTPSATRARGGSDLTSELRALMELQADPELRKPRMGARLADKLGLGASTGRRLHSALVKDGALTEYAQSLIAPPAERSR